MADHANHLVDREERKLAAFEDVKATLDLTEPEARQLLRVSKITLIRMRKLADKGGLPFVKLSPGRVGYLRRDVVGYLQSHKPEGDTKAAAAVGDA